jgi:L-lactate utilization protein LutC
MQYRPGVVASAHPGGAVTATILSVGAIRTCSIRSASNASEGTMPNERERFLETVRRAVAAGNQAGAAPPLPERGQVGYQGAAGAIVRRFADELSAAGGVCQIVADDEAAASAVAQLLRSLACKRVLVGAGRVLDRLDLASRLRDSGVEVSDAEAARDKLFAADVGISGVDYLIAETGSIVLLTAPRQPRALSLLPPVHIAIAERGQLLADLFDLFDGRLEPARLPAGVSIITGPSKTGDIELRLVTGVHGPGVVHVIVIDPAAAC